MFYNYMFQFGAVSIISFLKSDIIYILFHNHNPTWDIFVLYLYLKEPSVLLFLPLTLLLMSSFSLITLLIDQIFAQGNFLRRVFFEFLQVGECQAFAFISTSVAL